MHSNLSAPSLTLMPAIVRCCYIGTMGRGTVARAKNSRVIEKMKKMKKKCPYTMDCVTDHDRNECMLR